MSRESDDTYFVNALREFLGLQPIAYTQTSGKKGSHGEQKDDLEQFSQHHWQLSPSGCFKTPTKQRL